MDSSLIDLTETSTLQAYRENSAVTPTAESRTEKPPAPAEPNSPAPTCPRCGRTLTDPQGLGWCAGCGYCRSLEEDADKAALAAPTAPRKTSALGAVEFCQLLGQLPRWLWVLIGGIAVVTVISIVADRLLPTDSLPRALWCTLQLAVGLFGLFVAQAWAFVLIAPHSDRLSAKDLVLSPRLWSMTFHRLPGTQRQVWLGAWSLAAILSAVGLVGGFSYWYQFYKPKKVAERNLIQAIIDAGKRQAKDKSMEEALDEFAGNQDLSKKPAETKKEKEDTRPTVQCVILGYTVEEDKEARKEHVASLVLASVVEGQLKFAGSVRRGISPQASEELLKQVAPLVQQESFLPGLKLPGVVWIKPQLFCEVHQSGVDADGRLQQPSFKELLTKD